MSRGQPIITPTIVTGRPCSWPLAHDRQSHRLVPSSSKGGNYKLIFNCGSFLTINLVQKLPIIQMKIMYWSFLANIFVVGTIIILNSEQLFFCSRKNVVFVFFFAYLQKYSPSWFQTPNSAAPLKIPFKHHSCKVRVCKKFFLKRDYYSLEEGEQRALSPDHSRMFMTCSSD